MNQTFQPKGIKKSPPALRVSPLKCRAIAVEPFKRLPWENDPGWRNETIVSSLMAYPFLWKTGVFINARIRHPILPSPRFSHSSFKTRFEAIGCEMESFEYRKVVDTTDGVPWVVETAFGWIPDDDRARRLVTGVNWSPGIVNPFRELGSFGQSLDTILSQQRADQDEPIILVLHMACPRVEYTDRGKSAVVVT